MFSMKNDIFYGIVMKSGIFYRVLMKKWCFCGIFWEKLPFSHFSEKSPANFAFPAEFHENSPFSSKSLDKSLFS